MNGFESKSTYQQGVPTTSKQRYFTTDGDLRQVHLPHLAQLLSVAADGHPLIRLARIYDRIFIDECQDFSGYDLEILDLLLRSPIPVHMVGDIRQATLSTNPQERKNSKFQLAGIECGSMSAVRAACSTWSTSRSPSVAGRRSRPLLTHSSDRTGISTSPHPRIGPSQSTMASILFALTTLLHTWSASSRSRSATVRRRRRTSPISLP